MILAAFLDLGLPLDHLRAELAHLDLHGFELATFTEIKQGLAATRFEVRVQHQNHHRHWADIRRMIETSGLSDPVKARALAVFERLARAEARIHGVEPDRVHFHEVGAVDSIVDMVGAAVAWEYFGLTRLYVSPLPLGRGFVNTAHGRLPLPAPATLALLEGVPTYGTDLEAELVTPTGAALLATLAHRFGTWPAMTIDRVGLGAGSRDLPDRPNVLRLVLGREAVRRSEEHLVRGETNLDDMNPEIVPHLMDRLFEAGALDVWLTPIQMKKGRMATQVSFLCRPGAAQAMIELVLTESTTLGLRAWPVERHTLPRESRELDTPWGPLQVKAVLRGECTELVPEYEACRRVARETGLPLRDIYDRVKALGLRETE